VAAVRDLAAPGPAGLVPLRLYRPLGAAAEVPLPALVFFHGGGWVIGDLDTHDVVCRRLANASGAAIVSVDYRLAPEHKFPAAVEDAFAVTGWAAGAGAAVLGIDGRRLAVGGDSAGGNLATVTALLARDAGGPALRCQLLIYPATDLNMRHESQRRLAEGHLLTRSGQEWFHAQYLRSAADRDDWRASPLLAPSLAALPRTYVLTAGHDPLGDEGEAYARRLREAGVAVTERRFPGQIHGFITMGRMIAAAGQALDDAGAALKEAL
jgi:acetyl esterase